MTTRNNRTTRKKVKVVGTQTYINQTTGELTEMEVIEVEERDFNFHKLWIKYIIHSIDLIGNKKTKLAFWIVDQVDKENKLTMTIEQIAKKSGYCYQTVHRTITALIESNFLIKINSGAYRINPDVMFKGGKTDRLNVLTKYIAESEESKNESKTKAKTTETDEKQSNAS